MEPNHQRIPFDDNRRIFLTALSFSSPTTAVPLLADPATGALLVESVGEAIIPAVNVGQQTVGTTAVRISSTSTIPANGILVGAMSTNSASIFIGGSGVTTTTGAELAPGSTLPFTCNLNTLYIISAASTTDKVFWNVT